jgi:hypothetical protein
MSVDGPGIEVVRGALDEAQSEELVRLLAERGAFEEAAARELVEDVVCVARNDDGELIAVDWVQAAVPQPPNRPLWVYRSLLAENSDALRQRMFTQAVEALQEEFDSARAGPIGVCLLIEDEAEMARRPDAIWPEEGLIFAGYTPDGAQVRVRWFWEAVAEAGLPNSLTLDQSMQTDWGIDERYRVEPYTGDAQVASQILAMWARERAVVPEQEARRRVHEALNVVIERDEGVIAVSTAYVQHNAQLRMPLWYFRTFVSSPHRNTHVATQLTMHNRDLLERKFVAGVDTRAGGVAFELENRGMRKYMNTAIWQPANFIYIGDNDRGVPVRVHYFPGARVPQPHRTLS